MLWTLVVLRATLWPSPPQRPVDGTIRQVIDTMHDAGAPRQVNYRLTERLANVAMFVPIGLLLAALVPRRWGWVAAAYGFTLSAAVELGQAAWFPERDATIRDVALNTAGAVVGWLAVVAWRGWSRRRTPRGAARYRPGP